MRNYIKKFNHSGFTLIELLVVLGILAVLSAIVLIAINPVEQFNQASDVATKSVQDDFMTAINYYYIAEKALPWVKDSSCQNNLLTGKTLSDLSSCAADMTGGGQLQSNFLAASEPKNIYVTECNNQVALSYRCNCLDVLICQ